jgi:hypothetical protein
MHRVDVEYHSHYPHDSGPISIGRVQRIIGFGPGAEAEVYWPDDKISTWTALSQLVVVE